VLAALSRPQLNLVMHDFNPGWDSYIERRGYGREAGLKFDDVKVEGVCRGIRSGRPDDGAPAEQRESDLNRTRSKCGGTCLPLATTLTPRVRT
jgi:hypothetical protein